jgi:hypothetical protein
VDVFLLKFPGELLTLGLNPLALAGNRRQSVVGQFAPSLLRSALSCFHLAWI